MYNAYIHSNYTGVTVDWKQIIRNLLLTRKIRLNRLGLICSIFPCNLCDYFPGEQTTLTKLDTSAGLNVCVVYVFLLFGDLLKNLYYFLILFSFTLCVLCVHINK